MQQKRISSFYLCKNIPWNLRSSNRTFELCFSCSSEQLPVYKESYFVWFRILMHGVASRIQLDSIWRRGFSNIRLHHESWRNRLQKKDVDIWVAISEAVKYDKSRRYLWLGRYFWFWKIIFCSLMRKQFRCVQDKKGSAVLILVHGITEKLS